MAIKKKGDKLEREGLPAITLERLQAVPRAATIKDGWTASLQREGYMRLDRPGEPPAMVELASINDGDELPRDTDERFAFPPAVGGQ